MAEPLQDVVTLSSYLDPSREMRRQQAAAEGKQKLPEALQQYDGLQEMVQTRTQLRQVLKRRAGDSARLNEMIRELRRARQQVRSERERAEEKLRRQLKTRDEAHLMVMGVLE